MTTDSIINVYIEQNSLFRSELHTLLTKIYVDYKYFLIQKNTYEYKYLSILPQQKLLLDDSLFHKTVQNLVKKYDIIDYYKVNEENFVIYYHSIIFLKNILFKRERKKKIKKIFGNE